ncbi:unnamed protein product [Paramecium primaurelia]|uniref:Uncharacterized protein n=1 Tax=Paramecium primaurelia TaxID=5886 RepID=A0A8S1PWF2_PARPR|nr:unnamed protein product [Paramecium primaurelia]
MYQQNKKSSYRNYQISRVNSKVHQQEKSTSPSMNSRQQITPNRKQQFSLPKFDTTNNYLQQPITREHMLKFLEQIVFAVENVQCILSKPESVQNQMPENQDEQKNKFKITQEQQTDQSFIQQQLQSKFKFVNKKTQTPNRTQSFYQESELKYFKATKLKTEFSEESDTTEKQSFKLPIISQQSSTVKQKISKILPDGTKNRIQSQVIQYQYYKNHKDNHKIQSQCIKGFHQESQSIKSQKLNESSQQNIIKTEQSENEQVSITPKQSKINHDTETQKKKNNIHIKDQSSLNQTTKVQNDKQNNQLEQSHQSIISKTSNNLVNQDTKQNQIFDLQTSQDKNINSQPNSIQQEDSQNIEIKQKIKKRPIHLKQTNQINNDSLQFDKHELSINSNQINNSLLKSLQLNDASKIQEQSPSDQVDNQQINQEKSQNNNKDDENIDLNKKQDNQAQIDLSQQLIKNEAITHRIQEIQLQNPIPDQQDLQLISNRQSQNQNKTLENEEFYFEPEEENKVISKLQPKINLQDQEQLMNKTSSTVKSVYILNKEEILEKGNSEIQQGLQNQENLNQNDTQQLLQIENENTQNQLSKKNSINETQDQNQKSEKKITQITIRNDLVKSLFLEKQQGEINEKLKSLQQSQIYTKNDLNKQLNLEPTDQIKENQSKKIQDISQINQKKENQNIGENHQFVLNQLQSNENENSQKRFGQESLHDQNNTINISQDQLKQIKSSENIDGYDQENNHDLLQKDLSQNNSQGLSNRSMIQSKKINFPKETQGIDSNLKII